MKKRITKAKTVGLYNEIERRVGLRLIQLQNNTLYRIVVFNGQRTVMADCKDN